MDFHQKPIYSSDSADHSQTISFQLRPEITERNHKKHVKNSITNPISINTQNVLLFNSQSLSH